MTISRDPELDAQDKLVSAFLLTGMNKSERRRKRREIDPPSDPQPGEDPDQPNDPPAVSPPPNPFRPIRGEVLVTMRPEDLAVHFGLGPWDTGATAVQVALLTKRVVHLTAHLKAHPKDQSTKRGLQILLGRRRALLRNLQANDIDLYRAVLRSLPGLDRLERRSR